MTVPPIIRSCAVGRSASGRWWWSCCHPSCDEYRSGYLAEENNCLRLELSFGLRDAACCSSLCAPTLVSIAPLFVAVAAARAGSLWID